MELINEESWSTKKIDQPMKLIDRWMWLTIEIDRL